MLDNDDEGLDGGPIETFEDIALAINIRVIQGNIKAVDQEGQILLDHLAALVDRHENLIRQGVYDSPLN